MKPISAETAYKELIESNNRLKTLKENLEMEKYNNIKNSCKYRVKSVSRVLQHIRDEYRANRLCDLETLLRHCQDKLNGSIDGIELELKEGKPFRFEKDEQEKRKERLIQYWLICQS